MRNLWALLFISSFLPGCGGDTTSTEAPSGEASGAPPGADYSGKAFDFKEIRPGIFHAVGTGNLAVGANPVVVVTDDGVLVVESGVSPAAAWALQQELGEVTDAPVRYVIDTHAHFENAHGNAGFSDDVEVLAHPETVDALASGASQRHPAYERELASIPERLEEAESELTRAIDQTDPFAEEAAAKKIAYLENYQAALEALDVRAPTPIASEDETLTLGGRTIRLLHLGPAHTSGDVVVYLPDAKVAAVGNLVGSELPYLGDAHFEAWIGALDRLKELDVEVLVPAHGEALEGTDSVDSIQDELRSFWERASELKESGTTPEEAAEELGRSLDAVTRAYAQLGES